MTSPLFRSKQWAVQFNGISLAPPEPPGSAAFDIVHGLWIVGTGHTGFTFPSGWAQKGAGLATTEFAAYFGWTRRDGSVVDTTSNWTGSVYAEAVISSYSGCVVSGDPYDTFQEQTLPAAITGPQAPAAASTSGDTTFCMFGGDWAGSNGSPWGTTDGSTIRSGAAGDDVGFSDIAQAFPTTFTPSAFTGFAVFSSTRYGATAVLSSVGGGGGGGGIVLADSLFFGMNF